jgi:inorganic pyrophosphatase
VRSYEDLEPFRDDPYELYAVVETPKGSRNKYSYDEKRGLFRLSTVLPAGAAFPFDFGFVPQTLAEDGDALDLLILMDEPAFPGCLVAVRLLGVIQAEQQEDGEMVRNDRVIGVAEASRIHRDVRSLDDLSDSLLDEIQHFFKSYNVARERPFEILGVSGPDRAKDLVKKAYGSAREAAK